MDTASTTERALVWLSRAYPASRVKHIAPIDIGVYEFTFHSGESGIVRAREFKSGTRYRASFDKTETE